CEANIRLVAPPRNNQAPFSGLVVFINPLPVLHDEHQKFGAEMRQTPCQDGDESDDKENPG
ncbi:hypothetical protein LJC49_11285, partial [Ruminococcaceae bacterium OttesenSCG-928-I18]|nr:hypothetical protein [Ruminococcaceae bacterium OttesenSCG-928-I18]